MNPVSYAGFLHLAMPEVIVVLTALIVLAVDLVLLRSRPLRSRLLAVAALASIGCVAAILALVSSPDQVNAFDGMLVANPLTHLVQIGLLVITVFTFLLSVESTFTEHIGEFALLVLLATAGMMFLVGSQNILTTFVSLELLSLPLYILTGFDKSHLKSSEAALKYFLFGGMSAAFLLFGFSLLYGLSNATGFSQIAASIHGPLSPLLIIAIVMTVIGLGFKVAAVPLHFWAPDVYEAAPMPVVAFIASGSKVASFFVFFQILVLGFAGAEGSAAWMNPSPGWVPVVAAIAVLSMLLGNLVAIVQDNLRRLLAYSAIAHAGYMLIAIVAHTRLSLAALLYYVVTYALATMGAFGVVDVVEKASGNARLSSFDGLSRRAPVISLCLLIFLLSLAGIPPLAGFFGKFYLFVSAIEATPGSVGLLWLVALAIAMSAVSLYYYLKVLKRVYGEGIVGESGLIEASRPSVAVIAVLAGAVALFGCAPHLLLQWIIEVIGTSTF